MKRFTMIQASLIAGLALTACGGEQKQTERTQVGNIEFAEPSTNGLPEIKLMPYEESSFALADKNPKNQELLDLIAEAKKKIDEGLVSGNNLVVTGVHYSNTTASGSQSCTKVQIQQRSAGKVIVKDTLVPASEKEACSVTPGKGLNFAALAILLKIQGNWAAGVGVGAIAYVDPYIAGCAAGAVGYVLANGQANGTAGAFCTQIYNVQTGATYK